jgi:hypothetical protein
MIEKIKEAIKTTVIFIAAIYIFIALTIAGPYFTWKDIQGSNSFLRYIVISPIVGWFQGVAWPYYLYEQIEESEKSEVREVKVKNLGHFVAGKEYLLLMNQEMQNLALRLMANIIKNKDNPSKNKELIKNIDLTRFKELLELSKASFNKCDDKVLNDIHHNLSYIKNQLLLVLDYYNTALDYGINSDKARVNFEKGDAILLEVNTLMEGIKDKSLKIL